MKEMLFVGNDRMWCDQIIELDHARLAIVHDNGRAYCLGFAKDTSDMAMREMLEDWSYWDTYNSTTGHRSGHGGFWARSTAKGLERMYPRRKK